MRPDPKASPKAEEPPAPPPVMLLNWLPKPGVVESVRVEAAKPEKLPKVGS